MIAWAKSIAEVVVILPMVFLVISASADAVVKHTIATMPKGPGLWADCAFMAWDPEAIVPAPWETRIEEGKIADCDAKPVPIWNRNRSGDAFVAFALSVLFPWLAS